MNLFLAVSITINLAIIAVVTYFFKKHKLLQFIYNKNAYQEYETIFNSIFKYAPYSIVIQRIDTGECLAANQAFLDSSKINAVRLRCVKYVQNLRGLCYKTVA